MMQLELKMDEELNLYWDLEDEGGVIPLEKLLSTNEDVRESQLKEDMMAEMMILNEEQCQAYNIVDWHLQQT